MRRDVKEDVKSVLIGAVKKAPSQGYGIEILDKGDPEFLPRHNEVMISDHRPQTTDHRPEVRIQKSISLVPLSRSAVR